MTKENILLTLLLTVSLSLLLINLNFPPRYYFDENYTAFTAQKLAQKNIQEIWKPSALPLDPPKGYEWSHPPLARLAIAAAIKILGNKPWVWRLPSVVAGTLSILLTYALGKHFFSKTTGLTAAFILTFDGLHFASSRIATKDSLLVCLCLASLYLASRRRLPLSAVLAGMAIATKWIAIAVIPLIILFYRQQKKPRTSPIHTLLIVILIPLTIYLVSYLPFFAAGFNFADFVSLQKTMLTHAFSIDEIHPFESPWYLWPFGLKPIPYFTQAGKELWAMPNPVVFWVGLAAILFTFSKAKKGQTKTSRLILTGYLVFLLPWILLSTSWPKRPTYLYYYLPALPFLHLLSASWLSHNLTKPGLARTATLTILSIIPLVFLFIYPHLVGL